MGVVAVLIIASAALAQAPPAAEAPRRTIEPITGSVYRAMNNNAGTVFMVTPDGILLADPLNVEFAQWLKAEFATRFKVPVRYVVYSHHHWDHASGGSVFADTAQFVGHANMLPYLAMPQASTTLSQVTGGYAPVAKLDVNRDGVVEKAEAPNVRNFDNYDANRDGRLSGAEVARGPVSFVHPPTITYTDRMQISLGGKRVELSWVGDFNHSRDGSDMSFPDDNVLFIVDYVSFHRLPRMEMDYHDGKFKEWLAVIRNAEKKAAGYKFVATGHGPMGTVKDVTAWREYLEKLQAAVAAGLKAGQTLEQMQASIKMPEYSHWEGFKDDWVPLNVLGMYHFLTDTP